MHETELVLATGNPGKREQFEALLSGLHVRLHGLDDSVPECDEPFGTFVENALAKARHACRHTGKP
ncbi:MAG: non-canonical purine NTP pyrophosphatase, partial [Betaproteobacteria bacterium]|nr:non-canonical purine NTP pyrophosphatase [Betaproteobacteria bacterium]